MNMKTDKCNVISWWRQSERDDDDVGLVRCCVYVESWEGKSGGVSAWSANVGGPT